MTEGKEITRIGKHWRAFVYVLNICRFNLIILIAALVLLNVGQGQDLLLSVAEDHRYVLLLASSLLWAFSVWLWARTLLEIRFPDACVDWGVVKKYRNWFPRLLAFVAMLAVAIALNNAGEPADTYFWPTLIAGLLLVAFLYARRPLSRWAAKKVNKANPEQSGLWVKVESDTKPLFANWREALATKLGKFALAFFIAGIVLFLWGLFSPITLGSYFNALVLLMVWGATFLPLGSAISYAANKKGIPLITLLILLAVVSSSSNDNHAIRPFDSKSTQDNRPHIAQALKDWEKAHCVPDVTPKTCDPFIIVATAGGGIRAAYWTGLVLGHLHDKNPAFDKHVFAISGVSGGSVGATVYRSVLADAGQGTCKDGVLKCTLMVLSEDYLSPLSASLLYPDLLQRFLPWSLLPDRAKTFEESWEEKYKSLIGTGTLKSSFSAASQQPGIMPALFLNSTWSNNGRRIVASSYNTDGISEFKLSNDLLKTIGYDIRLSTAMHNSARFPYVSPPGSWHEGEDDDKTAGKIVGRLQDGGLFENFGAETAMEILNYARTQLKEGFDPFVVLISSDPALPKDFGRSLPGKPDNLGYEVFTTIRTLLNTRSGRGNEAAKRLQQWVEQYKKPERETFAYFRMCADVSKKDAKKEDIKDPPLGWSLSRKARMDIQSYLLEKPVDKADGELPRAPCLADNQQAEAAVLGRLSK